MAPLVNPQWQTVTPSTVQVLNILGRVPLTSRFYLAGGTALALRLGYRISQDLDFFADVETLDETLRRELIAALRSNFIVDVLQDSPLGLVLDVAGLAVGFYTYGYPLLAPLEELNGVQIAGLADIGLMKLDAIAGRGMRKDFYDLYFIARQLPLEQLFAQSDTKFPYARGFRMRVLTALVDFDLADRQAEPIMLLPIAWDQVKDFFTAEARRLGQQWFNQ